MPLDPSKVTWDDKPQIDHAQIVWDDGNKGPSWGDAISAAPGGAAKEVTSGLMSAVEALKNLPRAAANYNMQTIPQAGADMIMSGAKGLVNQAGGALQYMRNLSPENMRGSAPQLPGGEAENHPFLALGAGDTAPMKQQVAEHPLALALDAATVAGMTGPGRAMLGKGADLAMAGPRRLGGIIADMAPTRRAQNALLDASKTTSDPNTIAALLEGQPPPVPGVPLSAAQVAQDPGIAQLEKGSRINAAQAPGWTRFDSDQNSALFNALHGVVAPATDDAVTAAKVARDNATKYDRQAALALTDQGGLEAGGIRDGANLHAEPIQQAIAAQLGGAQRVVPGVQRMTDYVADNVGTTNQPAAATYEVRKVLADALNSRAGVQLDEVKSAAKSVDVSTRAIKNSIDASLDQASGGLWQQYLDAFKGASKDVNSTQALANIRADLEKKIEGGAVDLNGNPKLSRAYIKQVIERHSTNKYGDVILPDAQKKLDDILSTAQQIEAPQANYRLSTTGGGGSDSVSNMGLAVASHAFPVLGQLGRVASAVSGIGAERGATMLAGLLQSPADAAAALRTAAGREAARKAARSTGVTPAALAAALAAQQQ